MALTIPDISVDRGSTLVNTTDKSSLTKPYAYFVDLQGCGDFTHVKSSGTLTINVFDAATCKVTTYVVFSYKSLALVDPDVIGDVFTRADVPALLAVIDAVYGPAIAGEIAPPPVSA